MAPTSRSRVQLFRPILPSTEVYKSTQDEMVKKTCFAAGNISPNHRRRTILKLWSFYVVVVSAGPLCRSRCHPKQWYFRENTSQNTKLPIRRSKILPKIMIRHERKKS